MTLGAGSPSPLTSSCVAKVWGANLENWRSNAGARMCADPAVQALLPSLHLGYGRWPGGTTANYWNWRTGTFAASGAARQGIVKGQPQPPLPAGTWAALMSAAGMTSLIQINFGTEPSGAFVVDSAGMDRQVADQMAMLATLPDAAIVYLELGNEVYLRGDPASAFYAQDPAQYVTMATKFVTAVRAKYGTAPIRIGACSLPDIYRHINPTWRETVESGLAGIVDAFTYHHYIPIPEAPTASNADALVADALADFDHAYGSTLATIPSGHTAWLTEWNYDNGSPYAAAMAASPTHSLMVQALAVRHLSEPVVELTGPHACVGSAGSLYAAIAEHNGAPALTPYGVGLAAVGWLLNPKGPPTTLPG